MDNLLIAAICPHPPIIIPEVGRGEIAKVEKTIFAMQKFTQNVVKANPDLIVIVTPHSHLSDNFFNVYTEQILEGNFKNFGAPSVKFGFENDVEFIQELEKNYNRLGKIPAGYYLDHGSGVPLYYLAKAGYKGKIAVINYSTLGIDEHILFGEKIREVFSKIDRKTVFISSGDLSHRVIPAAPAGYSPEGKVFDKLIADSISSGNYDAIINMDQSLRANAGECGFNSLMVAFGVLNKEPLKNEIYSYEAPFGVGYLVATL